MSISLPAPTNAPEVLIALANKEFRKMQPCEAERSSHDGNRAIPIAERSSHDGNRAIPIAERSSHDGTLRTLYRTTGAILHELVADSVTQGDLFGERNLADKFETIHKQIDSLEAKFGKRAVYLASTHNAIKRKQLGTDPEDMDRNLLFL